MTRMGTLDDGGKRKNDPFRPRNLFLAFLVFLLIDTLWGAQLGIYPTGDSGPPAITAPSTPFTWAPSPTVPAPLPQPVYTGPGSLCRDGWVSRSRGSGTCSHHGGIQ